MLTSTVVPTEISGCLGIYTSLKFLVRPVQESSVPAVMRISSFLPIICMLRARAVFCNISFSIDHLLAFSRAGTSSSHLDATVPLRVLYRAMKA